jgi:hypothetical protein
MSENVESKEAAHGEKTIEVRIRFWTNELAEKKDAIIPKHGWTSGQVFLPSNRSHGITSSEAVMFNSFAELPSKIEELLIANGITLHPDKERRYLA